MIPIHRPLFLAAALSLALATSACTAAPSASAKAPAANPRIETAVFAMGCFWCAETHFEQQPGVLSVISGYTGGRKLHPTYEEVSGGGTGHLESIQVKFDRTKTSYEKLLDLFWHGVDPTQGNGQFCDHGDQYRSAIFYAGDAQKRAAVASRAKLESSHVLAKPIVTLIEPAATFWPAEEYHQDFWIKDPERYHSYREGCGRDRRLAELWGAQASKPLVH